MTDDNSGNAVDVMSENDHSEIDDGMEVDSGDDSDDDNDMEQDVDYLDDSDSDAELCMIDFVYDNEFNPDNLNKNDTDYGSISADNVNQTDNNTVENL